MPVNDPRGNFFFLLAGLLILILLAPVAVGRFPFVVNFGYTTVLVVGVWSLAKERWTLLVGCSLALASVVLRVVDQYVESVPLDLVGGVIALAFCGLSVFILLRAVLFGESVDGNRIAGAVCVYLLVGVAFGIIYQMIDVLDPTAFNGLHAEGDQSLDLLYYSFVTLTTLGYGDVSPASHIARALAYLEAVCGVMYLSILVASLIGSFAPRSGPPAAGGAPPA